MPEPEDGFFQEAMVVNYPSPDVPFTRIVEYKHVPNQSEAVKAGKVKGTLLAREYSSAEVRVRVRVGVRHSSAEGDP